mgnify:CR=1 FL=1
MYTLLYLLTLLCFFSNIKAVKITVDLERAFQTLGLDDLKHASSDTIYTAFLERLPPSTFSEEDKKHLTELSEKCKSTTSHSNNSIWTTAKAFHITYDGSKVAIESFLSLGDRMNHQLFDFVFFSNVVFSNDFFSDFSPAQKLALIQDAQTSYCQIMDELIKYIPDIETKAVIEKNITRAKNMHANFLRLTIEKEIQKLK